uniref:SPRY domain-containing protein n=1 Tax=Macrostomum lignano TaxID=282301 RepID=A0A1I8J1M0_9PLAT
GGNSIRSRITEEPRGWEQDESVRLDLYNSDLWLMIDTDGVRIGQNNRDVSAPPEERLMFLLRCGWSPLGAGMVLGEEPLSYGYGGSGKASTDSQFKDYGGPFDSGDVVGCFLEYRDDGVPIISYALDGRSLGVCYMANEARNKPLFPHLLTKNIGRLTDRDRQRNYLPPDKREDCTMLMMCGLPAAGKSVWAEKHCSENADKRYCVLGTNSIIDRLKVMGLPRQRNYHGRWELLIERATKCLNDLFEVACRRKRNYILDQTNVYASAQRRKMAPFDGYRRLAVVVVPEHDEYQRRLDRQRKVEGKEVPDQAIASMKANFSIPSDHDGLFDEVVFTELPRREAEQLVARYNREAAGAAGGGGRGGGRGGGFAGGFHQRHQGTDQQQHSRPYSNYSDNRPHHQQQQYKQERRGGGGGGGWRGGGGGRGRGSGYGFGHGGGGRAY